MTTDTPHPYNAAIQADREAGASGLYEYVYTHAGRPCGYVAQWHGPNNPGSITPDMLPGVRRVVPLDGVELAEAVDGWWLTAHGLAELEDFAAYVKESE
jgi:hypothetical protein